MSVVRPTACHGRFSGHSRCQDGLWLLMFTTVFTPVAWTWGRDNLSARSTRACS